MRLIENWWTKLWKLWSTRINALGLLILGWVQFDPVGALAVYNMMPVHVRGYLPPGAVAFVGMILFGLSMMARLVHQPKLEKTCEEKRDADPER